MKQSAPDKPPRGIECPTCGCRHFYTTHTEPLRAGCLQRRKVCRPAAGGKGMLAAADGLDAGHVIGITILVQGHRVLAAVLGPDPGRRAARILPHRRRRLRQ